MKINKNTSIPLDKFIEFALYDKDTGYYMKKNPIGKKGDFITAPNISVMFSEILAIWTVAFWEKLKTPKKINIVDDLRLLLILYFMELKILIPCNDDNDLFL